MDTTVLILLLSGLFLLFLISALFSAAETAYTSLSPATMELNSKKNPKTGRLIKKHVKNYSWTIATILMGNNIANVAISSIITFLFASALGESSYLSVILPIFVATPLLVIFGEVIPKIFAKRYAWGYLQKVVFILEFFRWLLFPLTFFLSRFAFQAEVTNTEDEMKTILKMGYKEGVLEHRELSLATRALDLDSEKIKKHYVKVEKITFLPKTATIQEAKELFQKTGFSRLPVKNKNNFIGVLLLKDIFNLSSDSLILNYIIEVPSVTINNNLHYALDVFRSSAVGMAFVKKTNNDNNIIGLITLEDIIEELVGEIYDEHDKEEKITEIEKHKFIILGDTPMSEIGERIGMEFASKDNLTTWIVEETDKNIKTGLTYNWENKVVFKVIKNKKQQVPKFEVIIK
ncbi:MAG: CNNM domain-containing protein [Metamycoplasmataceae bacterium]